MWDSPGAASDLRKNAGAYAIDSYGHARLVTPAIAADQYSEITYSQDPGSASWVGVTTRVQGAANGSGYLAIAYGGGVRLYRVDDSGSPAFTQLAAASADISAAPRRLRLESQGASHRVYFNGVQLINASETLYPTGQPGIAAAVFGGPTVKILSFEGGAIGAADTTPPIRSNGQPAGSLAGGTTQATLSVTTDENATCRYATTAGVAYGSMPNTFTTTGGTAHTTTVTGLTSGGSYNYYVRCQDPAANANPDDFPITFTVAPAADTTPPVRSNGQPSGTLAAGSTQAALSLTTNENAACRYATSAGIAYPSMPNTFTTTGGTSHAATVTGLTAGGSYNYYVRCQDPAANANPDDFPITFTVAQAADTTPPVRSNGQPTGMLPAGTSQTSISLVTNENATCRYATTAGVAYGSMPNTFTTTGATAHAATVTGLTAGGSYNYYVRCQDPAANANPDDFPITFTVAQAADTTPPVRSNGQPTGMLPAGTSQTSISLVTNENATCRYATTAGVAYGSMPNTFTTTGATAHAATVTGLTAGGSYNYYVRCQDPAANANPDDFPITFTVAQSADTTPPVRSNGQPTGTLAAGTSQTILSLATNENATCRYATAAGVAYGSMPNTFTTTGATAHAATVTGLAAGGSYSYYVRCQDAAGNANTNDFPITFTVAQPADTTPPVPSNGQPTGTLAAGTSQTILSLATNENATCRYATAAGVAYGSMPNTFTTTGGNRPCGHRDRAGERRQLQLLRPLPGRHGQRQHRRLRHRVLGCGGGRVQSHEQFLRNREPAFRRRDVGFAGGRERSAKERWSLCDRFLWPCAAGDARNRGGPVFRDYLQPGSGQCQLGGSHDTGTRCGQRERLPGHSVWRRSPALPGG